MGCTSGNYHATIYADGVPLSCPPKDFGCKNEIRRFTAESDLPVPVSYKWSLNGVTLSTKPYLDYKYTDKTQRILVTIVSNVYSFAIYLTVTGKTCTVCPVGCVTQTVEFSAGEMISLIDQNGKIYPLQKDIVSVCKKNSNQMVAKAVKKAIQDNSQCGLANMKVAIYYQENVRNCLTLTILNSPIIFSFLKVGGTKYAVNTSNCIP